MEQHRRGCGGDDFGDAGDVIHSLRRNGGECRVVGEAAHGVLEHNLAASQHPKGAAGKGTSGDGLAEHTIGGGEAVLRTGGQGIGLGDLGIHRLIAS